MKRGRGGGSARQQRGRTKGRRRALLWPRRPNENLRILYRSSDGVRRVVTIAVRYGRVHLAAIPRPNRASVTTLIRRRFVRDESSEKVQTGRLVDWFVVATRISEMKRDNLARGGRREEALISDLFV